MPAAEAIWEENQQLKLEVSLLKEQVAWLKQRLFGSGQSEKLDAAQLRLKLEELERQLESSARQSIAYERGVPKAGKHEPAAERFKDLPVEETLTVEPEEVNVQSLILAVQSLTSSRPSYHKIELVVFITSADLGCPISPPLFVWLCHI